MGGNESPIVGSITQDQTPTTDGLSDSMKGGRKRLEMLLARNTSSILGSTQHTNKDDAISCEEPSASSKTDESHEESFDASPGRLNPLVRRLPKDERDTVRSHLEKLEAVGIFSLDETVEGMHTAITSYLEESGSGARSPRHPLLSRLPTDTIATTRQLLDHLLSLGLGNLKDLDAVLASLRNISSPETPTEGFLMETFIMDTESAFGKQIRHSVAISDGDDGAEGEDTEHEFHDDHEKAFDGEYRIVDCYLCQKMIANDFFNPHWANGKSVYTGGRRRSSSLALPSLPRLDTGRKRSETLPHTVIETHTVQKGQDDAGNKTINEYAVITELGRGSYGKVKLVVHLPTNRYFAIKIMNKSVLSKIKRGGVGTKSAFDAALAEIAIMKRLNHPNICKLHEVIDDPECGKLYLIIDYVEKGPVFHVVPGGVRQEPLPVDRIRRYLIGMCHGLDYLHQYDIIHRDVKPDNILVGANDEVKLTDFGVSHSVANETEVGDTPGTPAFLSPEQIRMEKVSGKLADIWALGVTVYCITFGQLPFHGTTFPELAEAIERHEPNFDGCPDDSLKDLLQRLLAKQVEGRLGVENGVREVLGHPFLASDPNAEIKNYDVIQVTEEDKRAAVITGHNITLRFANAVGVMMQIKGAVRGFKKSVRRTDPGPLILSPSSTELIMLTECDTSHYEDHDGNMPVYPPRLDCSGKCQQKLVPKRSFRTEEEAILEETSAEDLKNQLLEAKQKAEKEFTISCVKFDSLPPEILEITSLEKLTSHLNGLTELSPNIDKLTNLTYLNLGKNNLTALPDSIGNLAQLTHLDCCHNKLKTLPDNISKLENLKLVCLDYNELNSFPVALCRITKLQKCYLIENMQVSALPPDLSSWEDCELSITNTPKLVTEWTANQAKYPGVTVVWNKLYPDKVTENVYLGSLRTAQTEQVLRELNITRIVTAGKGLQVIDPMPEGIQQYALNLDDNPDQKLTPFFDDVSEYIDTCRKEGRRVLVHCFAGLSRSVALVCAFLMKCNKMTFKEAITFVKQARPNVNPNEGFRKQLVDYEELLYGTRLDPEDIENYPNGPTVDPV